MVNYTCPICSKEFKKKCHFIVHTEHKKNPCKPKTKEPPKILQEPPNINACVYCGLVFNRKDNLKRHMNDRCKVKKLQHEEKETILELLIEKDKQIETQNKQIEELKNMILNLNKKIDKEIGKAKVQNINKGVINNNIIIPQSRLVNFGEEDVKKIPKEQLNKLLKSSGYPALVGCCNAIHNNPEFPEGMNSFISDKSRNKGMIWKDGQWVQAPVKKIFNTVMSKIDSYINHCEIMIECGKYNTKQDPKGQDILDQLQQRIKKYYERYLGDDNSVSTKASKEFEKMVRDNIIAELCSIRNNVMNNYNKILEDLDKNNNIANKELTQLNVINDRDQMINKIDDIRKNTENTKHYMSSSDSESDSVDDLDYDSDNSNDSEDSNDSYIILKKESKNNKVDSDDDDEYILKEVTLASGLKAKKWCKK